MEAMNNNTNNNNNNNTNNTELKRQRAQIKKVYQDLGLFYPWCNGKKMSQRGQNLTIPFSKYYRTEVEFLDAKLEILELICNNRPIPKELYYKISETVKELRPIYKDKYDYLIL